MGDFDERLARGDPGVCNEVRATFGRAVTVWLRRKYSTLTPAQADQALERALVSLWNSREQAVPQYASVSKRLNYFAELAAWALLLKTDFGTVAKQMEKTVYGYIVWMLRGMIRDGDILETAEDIRQQTFLCAWRSLDHFDPERSVKAWLWKIAKNCVLSELQRRKLKPSAIAAEHLERQSACEGSPLPTGGLHGEDQAPSRAVKDLCEILEQIPARHQELLYLSVDNERGYGPEAAERLNYASATSVRVTRNRLFKKIREEMRSRGHFACEEGLA